MNRYTKEERKIINDRYRTKNSYLVECDTCKKIIPRMNHSHHSKTDTHVLTSSLYKEIKRLKFILKNYGYEE